MNQYYDVRYVWSLAGSLQPGSQRVYADCATTAAAVVRQTLQHADSLTIHCVLPL